VRRQSAAATALWLSPQRDGQIKAESRCACLRNGLGHQVGTCRFGADPRTSVLDLDCKAHDLDNLYVVDDSFVVSSAAVNPKLTIIANALRVGDLLLGRLGSQSFVRRTAPPRPAGRIIEIVAC
jgi:choline dehydrogenase-like flavoprotein